MLQKQIIDPSAHMRKLILEMPGHELEKSGYVPGIEKLEMLQIVHLFLSNCIELGAA